MHLFRAALLRACLVSGYVHRTNHKRCAACIGKHRACRFCLACRVTQAPALCTQPRRNCGRLLWRCGRFDRVRRTVDPARMVANRGCIFRALRGVDLPVCCRAVEVTPEQSRAVESSLNALGERLSLLTTLGAIFGAAVLLALLFLIFRVGSIDERIGTSERTIIRKIKDRIDESEH